MASLEALRHCAVECNSMAVYCHHDHHCTCAMGLCITSTCQHTAVGFDGLRAVQSPPGWRPPNGMGEDHRRGGQVPANETSPLGGPGSTSETAAPLLPLQIKSQPTHFWSDGQLPGRASRPADRRGHLSAISVHRNWIPQPLQFPAGNIAISRQHRELPAH
ncbi:hypothetical protein HaLaN_06822 [Haematococcus lacustris]|uniref:Uncharacterized protein n=1 Tax=Haematococcus lacustris TaxID=44745 RepID=A0A699YXR7_HAELA|nr:hypothetical protein HaLaN_06822 [Haematococcus lacustris]